MHRLITAIVFVALLIALPDMAAAQKRVALVIGNGNYSGVSPLANPPNDARLMAGTLRSLGFEVIEKIDASQRDMKTAVRDFGALLEAGGDTAVGLFYYAGHGVQLKGTNYIIPVDAQITREGDVDIEAIDANAVLSMMEHSGAGLNFVILDACRNNPFLSSNRSGGRGLAEMDAPTGSFIAYATSPGDVAADGVGANSPYTTALADAMMQPGVSVERMFRKVRNVVRSVTNNDQTPWESSSLIGGDFFFNTDNSTAEQSSAGTGVQQASLSPERLFWEEIKDNNDPAMLEAYINKFPRGLYVSVAKIKIDNIKRTQVTAIEPTSTSETASVRPFGFNPGKYKPKVLSSTGFCNGVRIGSLTATPDKIVGTWRDFDSRGRIKLTKEGNEITVKLTGPGSGGKANYVNINGSSLAVEFNLRTHDGQCKMTVWIEDVLDV